MTALRLKGVSKLCSRRPHRKSRHGCGNCKLRRVKCDEQRPDCGNCRKGHVACDYSRNELQLQSSHERVITNALLVSSRCSDNETALTLINGALLNHDSYSLVLGDNFKLELKDLCTLGRFQNRTVPAFGAPWFVNIYKSESVRLAVLNPYLLHVVMTCTAMHDRYLIGQSHLKRTPRESYHWAMASHLFNHELSNVHLNRDLDAIWMTATMMSWISLYAIETQDPEEAWPLSQATSFNIPWSPIQKGLRTIWKMVRSGRQKSIFSNVAIRPSERCLDVIQETSGTEGIQQVLVDMCGLDESSTAETNPYFTAVRAIADLVDDPTPGSSSLKFLAFINTTEPEFEALLADRDPPALALMAIWYGFVPRSAWWISLRASVERTSICIYLDRHHAENTAIHAALTSLAPTRETAAG